MTRKTPKKPTRKDLAVGKFIQTIGNWDRLDLNNRIGTIIEMKDYGYILIEFFDSFSPFLHSGHLDIGKPKHCYYVNLNNIYEIINNELGEKIKNKQVIQYQASADIIRIFKRMNFVPTEEYYDISYLDIDKDQDTITYLPAKKFDGDPNTKKGRQPSKAGRILKKLNPSISDKDMENLVVAYRTAYKVLILGEGKNLRVVTGEDIRFWYSNKQYAPGYGSELWNSCMSAPETAPVFDIYCKNPDKIALCVYTNADDQLLARAVIWRLDDGNIYMDRIYAVSQQEKKIVFDYGVELGMKLRDKGGYGTMTVTVSQNYTTNKPRGGNPYMDTFKSCFTRKDKTHYVTNGSGSNGETGGAMPWGR